jgi:hypothetical protein
MDTQTADAIATLHNAYELIRSVDNATTPTWSPFLGPIMDLLAAVSDAIEDAATTPPVVK